MTAVAGPSVPLESWSPPLRRWPAILTQRRTRAIAHGMVLTGLLIGAYIFIVLAPMVGTFGSDAYAYWSVDLSAPYDTALRMFGSFPYSPPAAMVASTFSLVPLWVYLWLWTALLVGSVVWIGGTAGWIIVAFSLPVVALELYHGNIHILLGVAILLGFRHPWVWSFMLLTKITCGVGLLWFVVRREWRQLAITLGVTGSIAAVSFVLAPHLWLEWIGFLFSSLDSEPTNNSIEIPLTLRLPLAALVVAWGAWTDRRWTVFVAVVLALPVLWIPGLAILAGLLGLMEHPEGTLATRALRRMGLGRFATSAEDEGAIPVR